MLDGERASGGLWSMEQWHEFGGPAASTLSADMLAAIRGKRAELFAQWAEVPVGKVLELEF